MGMGMGWDRTGWEIMGWLLARCTGGSRGVLGVDDGGRAGAQNNDYRIVQATIASVTALFGGRTWICAPTWQFWQALLLSFWRIGHPRRDFPSVLSRLGATSLTPHACKIGCGFRRYNIDVVEQERIWLLPSAHLSSWMGSCRRRNENCKLVVLNGTR